jgi:hypothetical protein
LFQATAPTSTDTDAGTIDTPQPKKPGVFKNLQRFLRALSS